MAGEERKQLFRRFNRNTEDEYLSLGKSIIMDDLESISNFRD